MAWSILYWEGDIMNGDAVAIVIALIGVAGAIWSQVVQFKKDAQRIEGVNNTASSIKSDVSEIKPKVENIDRNCNIIRDDISRCVLPQMNDISNMQSGIAELVEAKHLDDKIKGLVSHTVDNPSYIKNAVDAVYYKNCSLEEEVRKLNDEKYQYEIHIQTLQDEKNKLRSENIRLMNEVNVLKRNIREMENKKDLGMSR